MTVTETASPIEEARQRLAEALSAEHSRIEAELDGIVEQIREVQTAATARVRDLNLHRDTLRRQLSDIGSELRAIRGAPVEELSCDKCGFVARSAAGLGAHKGRMHKQNGGRKKSEPASAPTPPASAPVQPAPAPAPAAGPSPEITDDSERACRCEDCDAAYETPSTLLLHVKAVHQRRELMRLERMPRPATRL